MKQLDHNWKQKSLENLEKSVWGETIYDSNLLTRCHQLRKLPLETFTNEDLRIMIGQEIGLKYLIPLAVEVLSTNLFAEGDYYEGDLLNNTLSVPVLFWDNNPDYWYQVNEIIKDKHSEIKARNISVDNFYLSKNAI